MMLGNTPDPPAPDGPAPRARRATPESDLLDRTDAAVDAEFGHMYGPDAADARAAIASAVESDGPVAYDRLKSEPEAFGTVEGDPAQAERLGGRLEALDYYRAVYEAHRDGRPLVVRGYGAHEIDVPGRALVRAAAREAGPDLSPVERAVNAVRERLGDAVSQDNVHSIQRTLLGLAPSDASDVVSQLEDDELREWAVRLHDVALWGLSRGYDDGERGILFDRLAGHLDGEQLARLARALDATDVTDDNRRLGAAVGGHASPEATVAFVRALLADRPEGDPFSAGDAVAIAMAVRGLGREGARVAEALRGAEAPHLEAVILAGLVVGREPAGLHGTVYHAETAMQVLHSVASTANVRLMASAFAAAFGVLERERPDDVLSAVPGPGETAELQTRSWEAAERDVRLGMAALLDADPDGVLDELKRQTGREEATPVGYAAALLDARRGEA